MKKRRRLSQGLTPEEFFEILRDREINYVVLRWYDDFPEVPEGEDIDILVSDEHLDFIIDLTSVSSSDATPVDVFSVDGDERANYRNMAYYPPHLASKILNENPRWHNEIVRVPSKENLLLGLAYHAVFHKGARSDLPVKLTETPKVKNPDHSYYLTISELASSQGLEVEATLPGVYQLLESKSFLPPMDTQRRIAQHNKWLRGFLEEKKGETPSVEPGCWAVFFVRENASFANTKELMISSALNAGMDLVFSKELSFSEKACAKISVRGGSWGTAKAFPKPAGGPRALFLFYDKSPEEVDSEKLKASYPLLENKRFLGLKTEVRDAYNLGCEKEEKMNVVHTTDTSEEAFEVLENLFPGLSSLLAGIFEGKEGEDEYKIVEDNLSLAKKLMEGGGYNEAIDALSPLIDSLKDEKIPPEPDVFDILIKSYISLGFYENAISLGEVALELFPAHPSFLYRLGGCYTKINDHQRASEHYLHLLKSKDFAAGLSVFRRAAKSLRSAGDNERARSVAGIGLKKHKNDSYLKKFV